MIPVILSGGSGTRLWPVSRASYPKQFCEFYDHSFLKNSLERVREFGEPYIVTVDAMKSLTYKTARELNLPLQNVLLEPMAKNTGPAVALLCHWLESKGQADQVVGIFPADHLIADSQTFERAVKLGEQIAEKGEVVTLGIQPRFAATGYGYVEVRRNQVIATQKEMQNHEGELKAYQVEGFREKPDLATAQEFMVSGDYYWNAGMFIFKVSAMINNLKNLAPDLWDKISKIKPDLSDAKYSYANVESISLDYAVMEKLESQVCIPCDMGWSDVGSWDELARLGEEYPDLRVGSQAIVFTEDAESNYTFSVRNKVIGLIGVDNLLVVDTPDALLISKKGKSQKVKEIVEKVKAEGLPEATEHLFEHRPWGGFEVLSDRKEFKAKTISVEPGAQLSYQSHTKREEHWVVVSGQAEVVLNDEIHQLKAGEHIFIPRGAKHRMRNPGVQPLIFVEVQTGEYFGEDDIVRYEDDYGR